jgi:hypothetical protein
VARPFHLSERHLSSNNNNNGSSNYMAPHHATRLNPQLQHQHQVSASGKRSACQTAWSVSVASVGTGGGRSGSSGNNANTVPTTSQGGKPPPPPPAPALTNAAFPTLPSSMVPRAPPVVSVLPLLLQIAPRSRLVRNCIQALNGFLLATFLMSASTVAHLAHTLSSPRFWASLVLWAAGFTGNVYHDKILLNIRRNAIAGGGEGYLVS